MTESHENRHPQARIAHHLGLRPAERQPLLARNLDTRHSTTDMANSHIRRKDTTKGPPLRILSLGMFIACVLRMPRNR